MKKVLLNGALVLTISGLVCKILGAFYRIPLSNILGAEGIGLYQMIFTFYTLALVVSGGAIPASMSISIAKMRAKQTGNVKQVFWKYFLISLILGIAFFLIFLLFAPVISRVQGNSLATNGYKMISFAILFSSLLTSLRGLFQGYENMTPTAVSQIIEQSFKLVLGLGFAYVFKKNGVVASVTGAILGIAISEILSLIYLIIKSNKFYKSVDVFSKKEYFIKKDYVGIFWYVLIIPLVSAIDTFLAVNMLNIHFVPEISTALYGIESGMVNSLINFPVIFSLALSTSLLPSLTYYKNSAKQGVVKQKIGECFNYIWIIILPCVLAYFVLAPVIMSVAYSNISSEFIDVSVKLLKLASIEMVFISFLQVSSSVLQASGKTKFLIINLSASGVIKLALTAILVSLQSLNIYGLVISNIAFYCLSAISNLIMLLKIYKLKLNYKNIFLPLIFISIIFMPCLIMGSLEINLILKLLSLALIGIVGYVVPILYFKVILIKNKKND